MRHWRKENTGMQKFPRVATTVPMRITTVDAEIDPHSGKTFFRSAEETTANLSKGGAYVRSWEPLAVGCRVVITITVAGTRDLQLAGQVAWTRRAVKPGGRDGIQPPGYGIEFKGSETAELRALGRFLERLSPRASSAPLTNTTVVNPQP